MILWALFFFNCLSIHLQHIGASSLPFGTLECENDSDCLAGDAYCDLNTNLCECPLGYTFSTNGSSCLQYVTEYKGECVDDTQCAWLQGKYVCYRDECVCESGWRWYQGRCIETKGLNETCSRDLDCYNGYDTFAMSCINGTCQCSEDHYLRGDYDCRPASYNVDDECALDSDCRFDGASCQNARCTTNSYRTSKTQHKEKLKVQQNFQNTYELDANCNDDSDCSDTIINSVCSPLTKKCICKRGFFYDSTSCIGELGIDVGCESDSDCPIKPGRCIAGVCYCTKFRYHGEGNRQCYKSMTQTNWNCTSNEWCYALGTNAYCSSERTCTCSANSVLDENYICQTIEDSENNEEDTCESDYDCLDISNSQCTNQKCTCKDNYREENGRCLPNIGASCDDSSPCTIDNASCDLDSICTCNLDYISDEGTKCIPSAAGIGDECEKDVQCDRIANTECTDGSCSCVENFSEYNGTCYELKVIGSYCVNRFQCTVFLNESVECRNSKCQCAVDYVTTDDGMGCRISTAANYSFSSLLYFLVTALFVTVTLK